MSPAGRVPWAVDQHLPPSTVLMTTGLYLYLLIQWIGRVCIRYRINLLQCEQEIPQGLT